MNIESDVSCGFEANTLFKDKLLFNQAILSFCAFCQSLCLMSHLCANEYTSTPFVFSIKSTHAMRRYTIEFLNDQYHVQMAPET